MINSNRLALALMGSLVAQPVYATTLAQSDFYTKTAIGCHSLDLSTWQHPTKSVLIDSGTKILKVQICNGGKYPVFTVSFPYDPRTETGDYFGPLYTNLAKANGFWPYALVDQEDNLIIEVTPHKPNKVDVTLDQYDN